MKCVICKSPDIKKKLVDEEMRLEKDIVLIPIEVLVCNNCGERYYDTKTLRKLETFEKKLKEKDLIIENVGNIFRAKVA